MMGKLRKRRWVAVLLSTGGLSAILAGYGLVSGPDGSAVGIPGDLLWGAPLETNLVPGILLLAMGLLALTIAIMQLRSHTFAWAWSGVMGLGFVLWVIVQSILVDGFRPPIQAMHQVVISAIGVLVVAFAFLQYRDWHLRWGATDEEVAARMPGDEHIPKPAFQPTRAITIDAPPTDVWPWLVQMGYGRAGFYSYDRLDNSGKPSLDHIEPALQFLRVGDRIPMSKTITEDTAFRVASIEPTRSMVWLKGDSSWAWVLRPLGDGRTRIVTRIRLRYECNRLLPVTLLLMEGGDFWMMRRCLLGIRARAERAAAPRPP